MNYYDIILAKKLSGGGGSSVTVESLNADFDGTYTAPEGKAYSPVTVKAGEDLAVPKDVNFFDYDGRLLYSYTKQEWANVTALPSLPSHDGLTAQKWTRTKAELDGDVAYYHEPIAVGCYYNTVSGKTELDIELTAWLEPTIHLCPNGTATIDWGDGSTNDTLTGTSLTTAKSVQHTYARIGQYTIKIGLSNGGTCALGGNGGGTSAKPVISIASGGNPFSMNRLYQTTLKHIRIASGFSLSSYAFAACSSLMDYTAAENVTVNGNYAFTDCYSLRLSTLDGSRTGTFKSCYTLLAVCGRPSMAESIFGDCNSLKYLNISSSVTAASTSACNGIRSNTIVTLPSTITSIGDNVFANTKSLKEVYIYAESVPTISSNSFSGSSISAIYVPYSADHSILTAYQTSWTSLASKIQEMPQ